MQLGRRGTIRFRPARGQLPTVLPSPRRDDRPGGMKRVGLPGPGNVDWLCTADAAKLLKMSTSGVRKLVSRGQLDAAKFGRELAFREPDVKRYALKPRAVGGPRMGFKKN